MYHRTSDLQDVYSVFGADIYCHKNCIRNYLVKYDRAILVYDTQSFQSLKDRCFAHLLEDIDIHLKDRQGFTLSSLSDLANGYSGSQNTFRNQDIRLFLECHYGSDLKISVPTEVNKSAMVFLHASPSDMADVIRSTNAITQCASRIRQDLLDFNFNLQDKFCDSVDLKEAWKNMDIPDDIVSFLCTLFNCDSEEFAQEVADRDSSFWLDDGSPESLDPGKTDDYTYSQTSKVRKIKSVFQILYFIVNNGKQRTPLHLICAEGIHSTCKSKTLITALNHLGMSVSYDEVARYHNDLADLVCNSVEDVPLPSHLNPDSFTTTAFDNFDHEEQTISGIGGSHDTVSVLYQDKPEIIPRKPPISETDVVHGAK